MAKKEYTFDEICRDIKSRRFSPVYVLMGEEPFFTEAGVTYGTSGFVDGYCAG